MPGPWWLVPYVTQGLKAQGKPYCSRRLNNNAARKAYLATGFTRIGDYAIVLLKT